jgi:3-hydroxyacyl-CoA dehydrogenase/enoyl-CoA hydratase/3-hydroxybutyryl-CoA epimerase/enoyl-CoA isomerase
MTTTNASAPMFQGTCLRVSLNSENIAELCFDRHNDSINKLDGRTVDELGAATEVIRNAPQVRGVLVTSAKELFIVGADIFEFTSLFAAPEAQIEAHMARLNTLFTAFADLPVPSITAINGLAFGGGLEMALASDARVMTESAQIGLPEVSLGLFPGYGGTVRLPRTTNTAIAIDWISTGKPQSARNALAAGAVEAVVPPAALRQAALERLESLIASGEWQANRTRRRVCASIDLESFVRVKTALVKNAVHQPAALAAVELIERTAQLDRNEALKLEHAAFARIARTQAAGSLIQLFINEQTIKRKGKTYAKIARDVQSAAVLGAGIMGGGIAYTSAIRGIPVILKDVAPKALELGITEAKKQLSKRVGSGHIGQQEADEVLASIRPTLEYGGLESVDVVIEAVVEKLSVKKVVLAEIEPLVGPTTIIASNTSSLSISELAGALIRPENFVGMHFFNPVPVMPLVEVIRGPRTSDAAAATIATYARTMGKTPIVVKECPGFLVNRILTPYLVGFLHAINDGADYLAIDRVMEKFGWPMGPAHLSDVIGMDTLQHVLQVISAAFAERMALSIPHAVELMVQHQRLGQKSGAGFFKYEIDPKGKPKKTVDSMTAQLLANIQPGGTRTYPDSELLERLMLPMVIEAARCLEDGIAESAAEVDIALVLGLGFPRYAGGPLKFADWLGLEHVVSRCEAYASLGPLYAPTNGMRTAAGLRGTFY